MYDQVTVLRDRQEHGGNGGNPPRAVVIFRFQAEFLNFLPRNIARAAGNLAKAAGNLAKPAGNLVHGAARGGLPPFPPF